jgi:hypothetical protein
VAELPQDVTAQAANSVPTPSAATRLPNDMVPSWCLERSAVAPAEGGAALTSRC